MPTNNNRELLESFGLPQHRTVYFIGGGGKTSLMFALADELTKDGRTVVTTTSTKILHPTTAQTRGVLVSPNVSHLIDRIGQNIATARHLTVARARRENDKLAGLTVKQIDRLVTAGVVDHVLVEADGAAGRSLKAHDAHEPVVSCHAELVIAVFGIDCLGTTMTDEHVHRAALLQKRLGRLATDLITVKDVAQIFFHPLGYLAQISRDTAVAVFVNKVATSAQKDAARQLVAILRLQDHSRRIGNVVIGDIGAR